MGEMASLTAARGRGRAAWLLAMWFFLLAAAASSCTSESNSAPSHRVTELDAIATRIADAPTSSDPATSLSNIGRELSWKPLHASEDSGFELASVDIQNAIKAGVLSLETRYTRDDQDDIYFSQGVGLTVDLISSEDIEVNEFDLALAAGEVELGGEDALPISMAVFETGQTSRDGEVVAILLGSTKEQLVEFVQALDTVD